MFQKDLLNIKWNRNPDSVEYIDVKTDGKAEYLSPGKMKKIFGKIENRRDEKENEKAHSSYIGKKFTVGRNTVIIEVITLTVIIKKLFQLFFKLA